MTVYLRKVREMKKEMEKSDDDIRKACNVGAAEASFIAI
jgi:hypothetical protein